MTAVQSRNCQRKKGTRQGLRVNVVITGTLGVAVYVYSQCSVIVVVALGRVEKTGHRMKAKTIHRKECCFNEFVNHVQRSRCFVVSEPRGRFWGLKRTKSHLQIAYTDRNSRVPNAYTKSTGREEQRTLPFSRRAPSLSHQNFT